MKKRKEEEEEREKTVVSENFLEQVEAAVTFQGGEEVVFTDGSVVANSMALVDPLTMAKILTFAGLLDAGMEYRRSFKSGFQFTEEEAYWKAIWLLTNENKHIGDVSEARQSLNYLLFMEKHRGSSGAEVEEAKILLDLVEKQSGYVLLAEGAPKSLNDCSEKCVCQSALEMFWGAIWAKDNYYKPDKKEELIFDHVQRAATAGYIHAQYWLGRFYYFGEFCTKDEKAMIPWMEKAAAQGEPECLYLLALWTSGHVGGERYFPEDEEKSLRLYEQSASRGNFVALHEMLRYNSCTAKSWFFWLEKMLRLFMEDFCPWRFQPDEVKLLTDILTYDPSDPQNNVHVFVFGRIMFRHLAKHVSWKPVSPNLKKLGYQAMRYYDQICLRVRDRCVLWMWMSKNLLPKEVRTLIGKRILASVCDFAWHQDSELRKRLTIPNPGGRGAKAAPMMLNTFRF
jgi:TPR repeat protein